LIDDLIVDLLLAFVVWRVVSFLVLEYGPLHIFDRLRYAVGVRMDENSNSRGTNPLAEIFCCIKCMSVWVSWFFVAISDYTPDPIQYVERVLIVSAMAILINRWITGRH
jgi:hypothetical protein